jgi:Na+/proline symporter
VYLGTVTQALTIFYALIGVTFFVPVLGGLYVRRATPVAALASIAAGILTLVVVALVVSPRPAWLDPTLTGIVAAALVYWVVTISGSAKAAVHE